MNYTTPSETVDTECTVVYSSTRFFAGKTILFIFPYKNLYFESYTCSFALFQNTIVPCMNALYLLYNRVAKQYQGYGECQSID